MLRQDEPVSHPDRECQPSSADLESGLSLAPVLPHEAGAGDIGVCIRTSSGDSIIDQVCGSPTSRFKELPHRPATFAQLVHASPL